MNTAGVIIAESTAGAEDNGSSGIADESKHALSGSLRK